VKKGGKEGKFERLKGRKEGRATTLPFLLPPEKEERRNGRCDGEGGTCETAGRPYGRLKYPKPINPTIRQGERERRRETPFLQEEKGLFLLAGMKRPSDPPFFSTSGEGRKW